MPAGSGIRFSGRQFFNFCLLFSLASSTITAYFKHFVIIIDKHLHLHINSI